MAPHGKELSEDLKKSIVALHKDGVGYKKIAKTLKLSCSTVTKTIQRFNRTGFTQNRPRYGQPKKLSARAQRHIQRFAIHTFAIFFFLNEWNSISLFEHRFFKKYWKNILMQQFKNQMDPEWESLSFFRCSALVAGRGFSPHKGF